MALLLALSLSNSFTKVGAIVAFAALVGIALLAMLFFAQARELKQLREWSEQEPQRMAELEHRLSSALALRIQRATAQLARPLAPAKAVSVAAPTTRVAPEASVVKLLPAAPAIIAGAAPIVVGRIVNDTEAEGPNEETDVAGAAAAEPSPVAVPVQAEAAEEAPVLAAVAAEARFAPASATASAAVSDAPAPAASAAPAAPTPPTAQASAPASRASTPRAPTPPPRPSAAAPLRIRCSSADGHARAAALGSPAVQRVAPNPRVAPCVAAVARRPVRLSYARSAPRAEAAC